MTAITFQPMTAADILREISLTPAGFGRLWLASVDVKGDTLTTKKRNVRSVSAISDSPSGAVSKLLAQLDAEPQQASLEENVPW